MQSFSTDCIAQNTPLGCDPETPGQNGCFFHFSRTLPCGPFVTERDLPARFHNTRVEPVASVDFRLKTPIFLARRLRAISRWAIRSGIAANLAGALSRLDCRRGMHLQGWVASKKNLYADQTEYWTEAARRYPSDTAFIRSTAHAALRAGRLAEAEAAFTDLIETRKTTLADCRFVVGLTYADLRAGNVEKLRQRVRVFLASLRGTAVYRVAAVRLSRVIFAHFSHVSGRVDGALSRRDQFVRMLQRSPVRTEPKALLLRQAACEAALGRDFPGCLFDTDVSAAQCRKFISLIRTRLILGQPFAFIRAGDGEAACLPYEPRLAAHAVPDARERERIWWGKSLAPDIRKRIAPAIAQAIWDADCIGIPTIARLLRELRLDQPDTLERSLTGRGLRALLYSAERFSDLRSPGLPRPIFTSCHLHQELAIWSCYEELLTDVREVVFISCHPGVADFARARFGLRVAASIVLPPDRISGPLIGEAESQKTNLPEMLDSIIEKMADLPRNRLVLVGAGYPGKILASIARNRGGVALDLGSIFDYWLGLKTRSYLDLDAG